MGGTGPASRRGSVLRWRTAAAIRHPGTTAARLLDADLRALDPPRLDARGTTVAPPRQSAERPAGRERRLLSALLAAALSAAATIAGVAQLRSNPDVAVAAGPPVFDPAPDLVAPPTALRVPEVRAPASEQLLAAPIATPQPSPAAPQPTVQAAAAQSRPRPPADPDPPAPTPTPQPTIPAAPAEPTPSPEPEPEPEPSPSASPAEPTEPPDPTEPSPDPTEPSPEPTETP